MKFNNTSLFVQQKVDKIIMDNCKGILLACLLSIYVSIELILVDIHFKQYAVLTFNFISMGILIELLQFTCSSYLDELRSSCSCWDPKCQEID